ncbi:UDP-N-acetylglucosamine--N-acetylmuramyl-(pentapeptide) pyrophosphoryl-UDP N-acetylglucosamine transferase [Candidatus Thioglobus autotrophicus]|jgi:UDP-N-acetylglucosamine--N-acetylmuramyl-(pentapeptide) pyrophosphoryl-undecaprenol N-acetylglucosamine transferase|uniref:UDP-N-acetylglucosamine--N-acetylmuramyl-(pentapeptide) pyrophosphoryl-undecaprenol N-acetylglucosamine transferase n=1 Tax=Candidatus Thioglobus autotrophicus TaxID=1705394 RepID=A0A0M4NFT9_9GAMM|nr:undecaprenyldiphospho-muramoylpentapeptide beta-N-acetylglucosaminyltransferase [Candidatus Thioglobus autotrophicus]ALE51808.1 UDP-N-acetylglucosamine--N-acetylmuramyl-(pentapeptide) pyrophosphoryl-UDP N-acetylglucosamine transferase [Candidatus Thioglobus autotrophicus]
MNNHKKILIMAGGTGGHIFPALAIAKELKKHQCQVEWLGSKKGMENTIVPKNKLPLHTVNAVGLRGKNIISLIKAPFQLALATAQVIQVFIKTKPDIALGMGGFASGIGGVIAWIFRVPLFIHEQNAVPGTTNKLLSKLATQTLQAFDGAFDVSVQALSVGNPVAFKVSNSHTNNKKLNLLIVGGSLGSKPINEVVTQLNIPINIWHQTGQLHFDQVQSQYGKKSAKVAAFIDDMAKAYAWADVVLCRAGAMTISELMLSATPSILIPLPHAIDNHQFYNAKILADNNAGILIEQKHLTIQTLEKILLSLDKEKLESMSNHTLALAKPNAARDIVERLLDI